MSLSLIELFNRSESIKQLKKAAIASKQQPVYTSPLSGSARTLFIKLVEPETRQILLLLPDVQTVNEIKVELNILGLGDSLIVIDEISFESLQEKLTQVQNRGNFILITTYDILRVKLPAKNQFSKNTTTLRPGGEISYEELIEYLNLLNYTKVKFVENAGDYSVRGSIIDFWSYSESNPARLEFDGDFLESIRHFDPESQRSSDLVDSITVAGNLSENNTGLSSDIFDFLDNPLVIASKFELNKVSDMKGKQTESEKPARIEDEELAKELLLEESGEYSENAEPNKTGITLDASLTDEDLFKKNARWIIEDPFDDSPGKVRLDLTEAPAVNSNFELLYNTLRDYSSREYKIFITSENDFQSKRLRDLLSDYKTELADLLDTGKIKIETLAIRRGFIIRNDKTLILTDYQIFNKPYRTKISSRQKVKKSRAKEFASIKRGDYVVHETYGIGRYDGLEVIKIGDVSQESIKILYAEGGKVYVNLNYFHLVKKFSSKDNEEPKLSSLGSGEWENAKKKVKKRIKEAARELIILYAKRKASRGHSFNADTIWQRELEASFFYEDTPDQARVTEEVKGDMESESPMDRLVCGDVGFGKTEIAVRAAFKAANDGKQTALLVPTTILAEQHMNTFKDRLSQFPVKVEGLSRFQTKQKQKEILKSVEEGKVDIVIGTHRLLSQDVKFRDLGLLIIDEEHRFGVMAKEKLRNFKLNVDTLTLTATPIPRTLNFSLLGARDLSIISTPPPNRQPIYTHVQTFDVMKIREWILNELKRNGQVYFVHDRVQSIEKIAEYIRKYIPEIRIAIAHGQMKPVQLENVIYDFLNKKYDVLLATKIIESGIDIPNVNTIIINRADRFGLAELHQLRGRVGRSDRQAYAYLLVPSMKSINKNAIRRLQAIEEFTDVGAGFNLSMRDLEIRGAGNLLGTEQTGFIDTVGFDMYVKLLDEAVEELKRQEFQEVFKNLPKQRMKTDATIDTYFEVGIPKAFMPDQADRLSFYTALFSIKSLEEVEEIKEEIEDRFGKLPVLVKRLIAMSILKYYASYALFERIIIQQKNIMLILPKGENEDYYKTKFTQLMRFIMDNYQNEIKFSQQKDNLRLLIPNLFENPEKVFEFLINFCRKVEKIVNPSETYFDRLQQGNDANIDKKV
ncbi:MAG: transcription-repair coupling factor [Ignavibacteria bacterium]|jgi:transcription-repair coupling factor (superfamily II helicase)|nr:transcription-repair coupling factor [Ignavibacteria bacterium]